MIDYNKALNPSVVSIKPSGIRRFFDLAEEMDNVISLGVGEPDFQTPLHIREAGIRSLELGKTRYTSNAGLKPVREAVSEYLNRRYNINYSANDEIIITVGGSEAIDAAMRALITNGDEVLIPEPSFVCYTPLATLCGGVPVAIQTKMEDKFALTAEALKAAITEKTKLLILPYPNNPTGGIMNRKQLEAIAEVIKDTNIFVLSDEIYAELTYGRQHCSFATIDGMRERTIIASGFSKCYSMTGWRLGYACAPAPIAKQMLKIHQFAIMSAPTTSQYAAIEALKNGDNDICSMVAEYDTRRRYIVNGFNELGLSCFEPEGAFYIFPCIKSTGLSSEEFAQKLLESQRVALVPGSAFGDSGEGFMRVSYCYSMSHIKMALERIKAFLETL